MSAARRRVSARPLPGTHPSVRDEEYRALSEWLAESPAGIGVDTAEGELAADWQRSVSAARWARLCPVVPTGAQGVASA
jgi:hypothetical protein